MSKAGKFIPGGQARKQGSDKSGPIRLGTDPGATDDKAGAPIGVKLSRNTGRIGPQSLTKLRGKSLRLPMSVYAAMGTAIAMALLGYFAIYAPDQAALQKAQAETQKIQQTFDDYKKTTDAKFKEIQNVQSSLRATLTFDSNPTGATVIVADRHLTTPVNVTDLLPGRITLQFSLPGYEDYTQDAVLSTDHPLMLGTVQLHLKAGNLTLTCTRPGTHFKLVGPNNFQKTGEVPADLSDLPEGPYSLIASDRDWVLPAVNLEIKNRETTQQVIKFPYVTLNLNSNPPGATVREGRTLLGVTPLKLTDQRAGARTFSLDLFPNTFQRVTLQLPPEGGEVNQTVTLLHGKDFSAGTNGMAMVWIPSGYWAGKYEVKQSEYETVMGANPSFFHRGTRPVDDVTWFQAREYCKKLTDSETQAGTLPAGYHYALPTESQWSEFSADADINLAATSRGQILPSTQEVGYSEPNQYGLYDTVGNVWEWCSDLNPTNGTYSMRGGNWLSSINNFATTDVRNAAGPNYTDKFIGFRAVLVKN